MEKQLKLYDKIAKIIVAILLTFLIIVSFILVVNFLATHIEIFFIALIIIMFIFLTIVVYGVIWSGE